MRLQTCIGLAFGGRIETAEVDAKEGGREDSGSWSEWIEDGESTPTNQKYQIRLCDPYMKSTKIRLLLILLMLFAHTAVASPVLFTFTADDSITAWYQYADTTLTELSLGGNSANWRQTDSYTLPLEPGVDYTYIWQLHNISGPGLSPGGFLAEIQLPTTSILSSSAWDVAFVEDYVSPVPLDTLSWVAATEYGANDDHSSLWPQYNNNLPVSGISEEAQWIWWGTNWTDQNAPWMNDRVYVRTSFETAPVPEPATMLLLGTGLIGLAGAKRRMKK